MQNLKEKLSQYPSLVASAAFLLLLSLSLFLLAHFAVTLKSLKFVGQEIEFRNTITVSGEGEITAIPDIAEFSFGVAEEALEVASAQKTVTKKMNAILALLDELGIGKKDIKTTNYSISPRYEYRTADSAGFPLPPGGKRVLVGYEVSHSVTVKMSELEKAGEALGKIGGMGVANVSGLTFVVEKEEELERDARRLAVKDAEEKARALADDFGVNIIKVVSFSEGDTPVYFKQYAVLEASRDGALSSPEIPSGENIIRSTVSVTYAID